MIFNFPIEKAQKLYPEYKFIEALKPSAQKASFHVRDNNGKSLCLKIISPKYQIDRLQREIIALQNIEHKNVANLVEYVLTTKGGESKHHIVEEFIDGFDLDEYLNQNDLSVNEILRVFVSILEGLSIVHKKEIVHRDLKPGNIRITKDGTPVIIDFGLARHLALSSLTKTEHGARIGTPKYFSPEQVKGTKYDIDFRTDLFSLGVILYEALIDDHPFYNNGDVKDELYEMILNSNSFVENQEFKELPKMVQILTRKMLKKDKIERFQSASQANKIIKEVISV